MLQTIVASLFAGMMGANGVPHFVSGICRREYPCVAGNAPLTNVLAGWAAFVFAAVLLWLARPGAHPAAGAVCAFLGALALAVFHAAGGAHWLNARLGRPLPPAAN